MTTLVAEDRAVAPVAEAQPAEVAVARSLARIEGRRLLLSPLLIVAGGLIVLAQFGQGPWVSDIRSVSADSAFLALLVAAMSLVASNLAALRGRRHGTEELFSATPATARARTGAHLLAVGWPALVTIVLPIMAVVLGSSYGRLGATELADLAVAPLLVAGAGVLGVMLARWAPTPFAGPLACVAIAAVELFLTSPVVLTTGWRYMAFWFDAGDINLLPPRPSLWHAGYLVALIAMAAVGALLRHGLRPRLALAGVLALTLMATSAVAQSRYVTGGAWARANSLLARPDDHHVCDTRDGVRYCAFGAYRPLIDRWAPVVAGVRERVPAEAWPSRFEVSQRFTSGDLQYTPRDQLRHRLPDLPPPGAPQPDDGSLHPGRGWTDDGMAELSLALGAASRVVGLPLAPAGPGALCDTAGQARAVVALWLAAQSTPAAGKALGQLTETHVVALAGSDPQSGPPHLLVTEDGVQRAAAWGMVEVRHALALQRRPAVEVESTLARNWARFTDPAASTGELASEVGLDPVAASELRTATAPGQDPGRGLRLVGPCR